MLSFWCHVAGILFCALRISQLIFNDASFKRRVQLFPIGFDIIALAIAVWKTASKSLEQRPKLLKAAPYHQNHRYESDPSRPRC